MHITTQSSLQSSQQKLDLSLSSSLGVGWSSASSSCMGVRLSPSKSFHPLSASPPVTWKQHADCPKSALGSSPRGPIEIKCTIAAVLVSLHLSHKDQRETSSRVLAITLSLENGFLRHYVGLSCFGRAIKTRKPHHRHVKRDMRSHGACGEGDLYVGSSAAAGMGGLCRRCVIKHSVALLSLLQWKNFKLP